MNVAAQARAATIFGLPPASYMASLGSPKWIALKIGDAGLGEDVDALLVANPFGDRLHAEAPGEMHERLDEYAIRRIGC